jgi:hypothetical protein
MAKISDLIAAFSSHGNLITSKHLGIAGRALGSAGAAQERENTQTNTHWPENPEEYLNVPIR